MPFLQCLSHNWYLSVDMQLYLMSPLFMVALLRRRRLGYILMALCICGSSFYNFAITVMYDLVDSELSFPYYVDNIELYLERFMHYHESIYLKPHTRMSSYFVGLTLGHYLWKRGISKEKSNSKITLFFGWIITAALLWICLYVFYFGEPTLLRRALYNGTSDFLFSCVVAWIIFVCVTGQGGFVNNLLSFGCFMPLSRLSYCAYLIHYPLILRYFLTSLEEGLAKWTFNLMSYIFLHVTFWTYLLAFLTSLLIEVPVSRLFQCFSNKTVK
ncbi:nose resistant to fluoxetine protein 6 [Nephila pilipes]|uniref:Nose resistant to fluoxetine protein 6 n=1 Tax=Nephila pilipes TaxID=299642 RepID=A0A8X6MSL8_NEPPI|nr:nose resistant to fluoxetine protein 6 [Nephila pilipes]